MKINVVSRATDITAFHLVNLSLCPADFVGQETPQTVKQPGFLIIVWGR